MSKKQKAEALEKAEVLRALFPYAKNINLDGVSIKSIKEKAYMINRSLNMAQIIFKANVSSAKIDMNTDVYGLNKIVYIEPGNYKYTMRSKGYYDEKGSFYAQAGVSKVIEKKLIVQSDTKLKVYRHI